MAASAYETITSQNGGPPPDRVAPIMQKVNNDVTLYGNPFPNWAERGFTDVVKWRWSNKMAPNLSKEDTRKYLPVHKPPAEMLRSASNDTSPTTAHVMWIGHSSFLVQMGGWNVLTDPVFSQRASPVQFAGPKRLVPTPLTLDELIGTIPIDVITISHNHYDHLDNMVVKRVGNDALWVVPAGLQKWFHAQGVQNVVDLNWWAEHTVTDDGTRGTSRGRSPLTFTSLPVMHWSLRSGFDKFHSLWAAFHMKLGSDGVSVFHCGDTGYAEQAFREIGQFMGEVDVALVPIGAYEPRWFMAPQHVDPMEAVLIHRAIKARRSVGMHWGTFVLTSEPVLEPPVVLKTELDKHKIPHEEFCVMQHGQVKVFDKTRGDWVQSVPQVDTI